MTERIREEGKEEEKGNETGVVCRMLKRTPGKYRKEETEMNSN